MNSFKDKVIYQIYPKSFCDSSGSGMGDLRGIIGKLDYLKQLGVDYLWITPFFLSPLRDNGYDVEDYYSIDPVFGEMGDLEELIQKSEEKGIGIMLDMVFNHTSTEHIWFRRALQGEKRYQDYYIFRQGESQVPPTNWQSKFGGNAWEYVPPLGKWYLHLFDRTQADLNWDNQEVREELKKVILFWKKKGIRGFRFDVVNLISKPEILENDPDGDGRCFYTDGPHVHEYLKELVKDTGIDYLITVGEMSSTSIANCIRYTNPKEQELNMCFNFHHLKVDYKNGDKWELQEADFLGLKKIIEDWQIGMQEAGGWNALFWCNHDQPRAVSRFGDDKKYWKESAKMLGTMLHMMRGTPYIYQGEELGMTNAGYSDIGRYQDVESKNYYLIMRKAGKTEKEALEVLMARSRDNGRTPMQWNDEKFAGFSDAEPWLAIPENHSYINAEKEAADSDSILNYYKELIRIRKQESVISEGHIEFIHDVPEEVFAYKRCLDETEIYVINNLKGKEIVLEKFDTQEVGQKIIGNYKGISCRGYGLRLRPYETIVYKIAKANKFMK